MKYINKKGLALTLILMLTLSVLGGCIDKDNSSTQSEINYSDYLIQGKTEDVYLKGLENLLVRIYSESNIENKQVVKEAALKYMTEEIADIMTREKEGVKISKGKCTVRRISYGYGKHQDDTYDKVLAQLLIEFPDAERYVNLEMRLDDEDKIYEFIIW